jgi:hypothetical protein
MWKAITALPAELARSITWDEWGRIVNGGAWLTIDGTKVDLIYRDLNEVSHTKSIPGRQGRRPIHTLPADSVLGALAMD